MTTIDKKSTGTDTTQKPTKLPPYHAATIALLSGLDFSDPTTPAQVLGLAKLGQMAFIPAPERSAVITAWTDTQTKLADVPDDVAVQASAEIDNTIAAIEAQKASDGGNGHDEAGLTVGALASETEQQRTMQQQ